MAKGAPMEQFPDVKPHPMVSPAAWPVVYLLRMHQHLAADCTSKSFNNSLQALFLHVVLSWQSSAPHFLRCNVLSFYMQHCTAVLVDNYDIDLILMIMVSDSFLAFQ